MAYVGRANGSWSQVKNAAISYCPRCCIVQRSPERRIVTRVENCRTEIAFFEIADVAYRSRAIRTGEIA